MWNSLQRSKEKDRHRSNVCVCMCVYVCIYVSTYVRTNELMCVFVCMYVCTYIHICIWINLCMYVCMSVCIHVRMNVKVKQSHYRPGQDLGVPGGWGSQISIQSAHEGGKVVSATHRPPLTRKTFLVLISVRGWVNPTAIVRPKGLCQWKIPMTQSGIKPATFRLMYERNILNS